ncbi:hypothetical protein [uncultured Nostoc sp.]|uniref:hypothetical protein n=1 Tax=uncultured Nostoc sp. TaxID=340711 RepID=UPI0035CBE554
MNARLIAFSGFVTTVVGGASGLIIANLFPCPYRSEIYQHLEQKYALVGAVAGLLIGSSQEAIRELKQERDAEEDLLRDLNNAIHSNTNKRIVGK